MTLTVPLTELRPKLPKIMDGISKSFDRCIVTRHGKPEAVIISEDDYESLMETLDVLSDQKLMKEIKAAQTELNQGKGVPWDKLKKKLGYA
jgi:antitoxin YefM